MTAGRLAPRVALFHYSWTATVVVALLLNVFWPPFAGYSVWALSFVGYPVSALLILTNRPGNRVGRVLATVSVAAGVVFVGGWIVGASRDQAWSVYVEAIASAAVPVLFWGVLGLLYLFPTGQAPRPYFRVALAQFTVSIGVMASLAPFHPEATSLTGRPNPIAGPEWAGSLYDVGLLILLPGLLGGMWAAISRYRSSGLEVRAQLKWFMTGLVPVVGLVAVVALIPEDVPAVYEVLTNVAVVVGFWSLPAAIVIAVTRHRLYEIDRLVSRTISYTLVVGVLAGTFFAVTTLISTVVPTQNTIAIALSTLTVAGLFNPLRKRAQVAVDKRFHRSIYEAELVAEKFGNDIRRPLELEQVTDMWRSTVDGLFQPEASVIWLASTSTNDLTRRGR